MPVDKILPTTNNIGFPTPNRLFKSQSWMEIGEFYNFFSKYDRRERVMAAEKRF